MILSLMIGFKFEVVTIRQQMAQENKNKPIDVLKKVMETYKN
jgi:hypothetical protein